MAGNNNDEIKTNDKELRSDEKNEQDIDDIIEDSGSRFQVLLQITTLYIAVTICWNFFISIFTGEVGGWKCIDKNSSDFCRQNFNTTFKINNELFYERCRLRRDKWTFSVPKTYSFVTEFDLTCSRASIAAWVSSAYYIGGFLGSILSGIVSDNFGRRPVLLISLISTIIFSIGASFVQNIWHLFGMNIIIGASSVSCFFTVFVFQLEYVAPSYRAISAAVMQLSFAMADGLLVSSAYNVRYWRKLKVYMALPPILSVLALLLIPESPRWVLSTGKIDKAKNILETVCKFGGRPCRITHLKSQSSYNEKEKTYSYFDLFRNRRVSLMTVCVGLIWFTLAIVAYALLLGTANIGGNIYQTFGLSVIGNLPGYLIAPPLSNRFGKKRSTLCSLFATGVLVGARAVIPRTLSHDYYVNLGIIMISKLFSATAFTLLYAWTFEMFPTTLRSQGLSVCIIFERIGIFLVPFITRLLIRLSDKLPYILMCALAFSTTFIGFVLPETNDEKTRETMSDVDGNKHREGEQGMDNFTYTGDAAVESV